MKRRVLVIDDERPFADSLVEFFTDKGFEARASYDAESGRLVVNEFDPHAIISDIKMPGQSGLDFLQEIRRHGDRRVVILVTAHGDLPVLWQSMRLHADGFMRKPLSMESLGRVVEEALERKRKAIAEDAGST